MASHLSRPVLVLQTSLESGVLELDRDVNREGQILTGFEDRQGCRPA
jgi:hypothetical protein